MAKTFTFEEASAPSTFTFEEALGPAGGADAGLIQSARSAPMLYGEDPINGPMQPQSSMPAVGPQTAVVTDPSGDGSVLKGVKFDPPDADPYLNRQARDRSVSPQSIMFTPAQELDRVDAYISRGEKIQAALKKAGYSSVDEFQAARQRSLTRQRIAEELPVLSAVASGAANQVAGLANFPQVTAEFVNKVFVDPVLTALGGSPMPSAPKTPGTESLMRAAADYMPKVGKKEFEDVVGTDEFRPWLIANMAQNSPQMVMSLASMLAPAVRPFVLPGMGATSAGNAYLQGDDPRVAMAKGAVEVGSEMLPLGVFDKIQSAIASMPRSAQKRFLADVGKRVMSGGAAVAATALTGGAEEWIAQYGGNVLDKYAQGKNIPLDKGAAGAYVLGAAMGTGMGMPHIISAMGDQSPQAQAERELAALLNGGQFSDLRGDEFANLNPNLAESDPGPTSSDQPASAADIFAQRWGKPKPAVPDPVATVQSATSIDGAITAAAQAVDAAFNERDRQQAKSEQAVSNIARILGTEIPDVGTAAAVPGVVEPAAGGGAPDAAAGVGAGVGVAGVAGQPVDAGGVGGQPTGRPVSLGAGQPGALNFAQPPGPVRQITVTPAGTLTAIGDPKALVRLLKSAGVTNVIPATNGITVGKSQASMARQVLDDFVAAPPENFEQDFQQELEREYQADIKAQLLAKRNPQPVKVEKKTQSPLRTMLRTVGIKPELAADITGESNRVRANNVLPFTFRKNGAQIDELVRIARERGFLTQDEDDIAAGRRLVEMIQADLRGEQDAEIARAAARYGLDISGMEIGQVANAVNRIERRLEKARADGLRREAAAEARLEREAIQAADRRAAGPDRILDDLDDVPENNATLEDAMRALGFTEQEISDAVAQESRRAQADRAGSGDVVAAAAGPAQGSDRRGESQARQEAGGAESRPQDLLGDAPNASQQAAARLRAEREEQDRRRQQAAPEAGGFMLSGSDRPVDVGAAAGQGDLPAGPPAAAPAPSPASTARNRFGAAFYNLDAENAGDLHALLSHKFAKRGALTRDDVPMEFSEGVDTAAWMNLKDAIAQNPQEFLAYLAEKAARATAPTAAGASPPAQQAELATTDAQRKQAADHAKDLGGRVVWQRGELALIEGFSLLSGDSVYVAAKGDVRTRVDIKSYTGNGYTEAERAELMQARADAVRAADEALARNPDGPFSAGPLVFAEDIPANVQGVVRGWIGLLGLDGARIVVTTPKSGAAMADGLAGKFRRIGKASLSGDNTNGTMQPLGGDDFHIAVRPNVSTLKMLEVLAHELGHIVERRAFAQADPATQQAIREAHAKWLRENGGGRAVDMAQAMRAYRSGQTTGFSDEAKAAEAGAYWRSFGEWFADQVSRWATTQDRPVGVVEQFFKRLADRLRAFFTGERAKFKPDATMAQWLDSLAKDVPPADEVAAQQAEPSAPAPAEPAPPEQQEGSSRKGAKAAKIEDFGQKLEGARKDYAATLKDAEAVDIAAEPLSKSWPEPDYDKLLAGGADPYVVAFVHAARDEVPTKPQKGWKLKGWVETVKMLREMSAKLLSGSTSKQTFDTVLARAEFASLRNAVGSRAELYQLVGHAKSLKGVTFSEHHYTIYKGQRNVRKWAVEQKAKATAFGNWPRELAVADTKAEMLEQFKAKMESSSPEGDKAKAAKGQFIIYRKRNQDGAFIGKKIGREYIDLKKLPDVAAARAYLDSNTADLLAALERYKDTPFERNPENRPRVGDDHRNGAAVTPEVFADTFGFRGVQFGNYVEQDRRQSDLNQTFDALMDMAAVLGVPPRALSLNGRLGLAFGARGKGGKNAPAAHYEPDTVVINLTKGNGPGSLGHEWWHAVDNYFGKEFGAGGFATDGARVDRLRAEMQAAFKAVRTATQAPTLRRRAAELDKRRSKPYWNTPLELSARAFESYLIAKLNDQGAANDYLANVVDEKVWNLSEEARATFFGGQAVETYPYPGQAELPDVRAAFDEFFKVVETREDDAGNVAMYARSEPALAGGMPLFGREAGVNEMNGASIPEVRAIVEDIRKTWKGGPSVVEVVSSYRDLPGRPVPRARGMYIGGKVYVVASSHRAGGNLRQAVAKTLSHEVIAHYGLRKILGADFDRLLTKPLQLAIASGNKPMTALREQVRRLYVDEDGNYTLSKRDEADEIAARAVENAIDAEGNFRPGYSWLKSVWARVAQFLRDRGIDVPFTQAELQGMLVQAQQAVRDGERLAGASTVVVTQQPVLSRRSAEDVAPAEGFWSKIKAGKSFTPQEIADAYARGVRGTVRAFAGFSGEQDRVAAVPGTEHAGWRDEIAGFDGYVTVGVSFADGSLAMGVIPRELYPGRGSALGLADLGEYSLATYAFTPNPDGSYRLDVFDPRRGGRVFDELARRGRLEETGDTDVAGQPYYRAVFDNRYTTSHSLIQEAVRRLGYHLGAVPTVVQIGRDTGSRANPGKEQVRTFTPEFIERRLALGTTDTVANPEDVAGNDSGRPAGDTSPVVEPNRTIEPFLVNMAPALATAMRRWEAGKATEEELAAAVRAELDNRKAKREDATDRDRVRGSDWLQERILRARRTGEMSTAEADLALWLLNQAPQVATDLGISIKSGDMTKPNGTYNVLERVVTIFTSKSNPDTLTHEILHHTERMMPEPVQNAIRKEWLKQLEAESKKVRAGLERRIAKSEADPRLKQAIGADKQRIVLLDWMLEAARKGDADLASSLYGGFRDGISLKQVLPYELSSPSEFWAVNAAALVRKRAETGTSLWRQARQWLVELMQKAKSLLGLRSNAPVIRGLEAVLAGDGSFVTRGMISTGARELNDQTDTDAFRRWFGDSKVVDENGKPLVVYHGTRADIAAFDGGRIKDRFPNSEGFYFTSNPSHASVYADSINNAAEGFNPASRFAKPATEGGNVMPVYVSLQNPKILTVSEWGTLESAVDGDGGARVRAARAAGHDGVIVKRRAGDGYDGDLVIAFRPEQIKSAIGNNGEFDPANPDIRYARGDDGLSATIEASNLIADFRAEFGSKPPSGMSQDEFWAWSDRRSAAEEKMVQQVTDIAKQADNALVLPLRYNPKTLVALHPDTRKAGALRITYFIADTFEPSGHEEYSKPEQAAAAWAGLVDPNGERPLFALASNEDLDADEAPAPRSRWLDDAGRLRFLPGTIAYDLLGKAATPLLNRLYLKTQSKPLRRAIREMKLTVQKAQDTAEEIGREVVKLTDAEREMVSDIIEKELSTGVVPPEHAVKLAATMNEVLGKQTDELVKLGMLATDTAEQWRGKYLARYYKDKLGARVQSAWDKAISTFGAKPMRGLRGNHFKGRGLFEVIPEAELPAWEANGWEVRDPDYQEGITKDGTVRVWRDFTRAEREKMGEIRDAGFRFVMGYMETQKDIALGRMFQAIAADPELSSKYQTEELSEQVPDGTISGTGVKKYGKLAGRWVSKETISHLSQIEESQSEAFKMYRKAMGLWKETKTSLNPVAHANNIVSNITMAHFAGVSYWDVHKYAKAMRDFAMKSDSVKEAKDAGLFLGTVSDAELMNVLPEDLKAIVRQQEGALTKVGSNAFNAMTWFLRRPMGAAYQAEDTFFRYLIWKDARDQGMSAEDAVDYSLRYIFAYDDLPLRARQIRDFMIPFFAYTYKAIPALLHTAANYPWRFAAPAAVMWGINAAAYAIAVGDDDDDWIERLQKYLTDPAYREKARAKEKMEREYLPEWMKGETIMNTPKAIRLGMDEVTKLPLFIDVYRMVPGGDMLDMNNNAGGTPWLQPFTPNHPLLTTYMAMFGNRDGWTGKDVVDKTDDSTEAAQKRLGWMWRQTAPALAYGNYHFERTMQALAQATGKPVQWAPEFMGGMEATGIAKDGLPVQPKYAAMQTFGLKVRPIDVEMGEIYDSAAKNKLIREIDAEMRRLGRLNAKGAVSDAAFDREAEKANVKRDRLNDGLTIDGKPKN